ncbi:MAG TPA: hypothetical protein VFP35_01460 [Candidatus Saccharimonadales bacterium]|nr:hypothetical protein [Candidatus Saccharimonadales bacterium]
MIQKQDRPSGYLKVWILAVIAVVVIAAAGGAWLYQSRQAPSKGSKPAVSKNQKPQIPTVSKAKTFSQGSSLTISELGVKLQVPAQLNGLSYTVTRANSSQGDLVTIQFALPAYSALANKCAGLTGDTPHPFANLSKAATKTAGTSAVKDMGDYVIVNSGSSVPPNVSCKYPAVANQLKDLGNQLDASLTAMFQSAQKI